MERLEHVCTSLSQRDTFSHVDLAPEDSILGTIAAFNSDKHEKKVNLGVGAYRDEEGKPYVYEIVRKVEKEIQQSASHVSLATCRSTWASMACLSS